MILIYANNANGRVDKNDIERVLNILNNNNNNCN